MRVLGWRAVAAVGLVAAAQMLSGCNGFFVYPGSTSTTTSSATDFAFVSNSATGTGYVNGYVVSSGTLVAATDSPMSLGFVPQAMAVSPNNSYLFVASQSYSGGTGGIYGYSIGTGGALTALNSGLELAADNVSSIDISADGNWLFALEDEVSGSTSTVVDIYSISSSGTLKIVNTSTTAVSQNSSNNVITPVAVKIAPSENYLAVALGTGGVAVFSFNSSSGATNFTGGLSTGSASTGINAIAIDKNNYLYTAGTILSNGSPGVAAYTVSSSGVVTTLAASSASVGKGPIWITVSTGNNYVYVANYTDSTISAFSTASGVLTALNSGVAYNAPTNVGALGRESTGTYLVALGYGSPSGTQIFAIGSGGGLTENNSVASGASTSIPAAVAMSQ